MKVRLSIFVLLSMFVFWSCEKETVQEPNRVIVEGADELGCAKVDFKSAASEYILNLEVEGEWKVFIPEECTWLVAEPASGVAKSKEKVQVVLRAEENVEYKPRKTLVSFSCDKADQKDYIIVTQEQAFFRALEFTHAHAKVTGASGKYMIPVVPTNVEAWEGSADATWVKVANSGDKTMIIHVDENKTGKERVAKITMVAKVDAKEYKDELIFTQLGANAVPDQLDVVFNPDGMAEDVSPAKRKIFTYLDEEVKVEKQDPFGYPFPVFSHDFGSNIKNTGAYTFSDFDLREVFNDGYAIEAIVSVNTEPSNSESKAFSSTGGGGLGLICKNKKLCYIFNASPSGSSSWHFLYAKDEVKVGQFYHILGTWDQASGIARFYVDGELVKEEKTGAVVMRYSRFAASSYMSIGANSNSGSAESPDFNGAWNGGVALARIYSDALTPEQVQAAYINASATKIQLYD